MTGVLRPSVASGGRGSPGAGEARAELVSNRSPRAAREVASKSRHVCGFEVVGRPKIPRRLLRNGAAVVELETVPTTSALGGRPSNERADSTRDRHGPGPSPPRPEPGSSRLPQLRGSPSICKKQILRGKATGREAPPFKPRAWSRARRRSRKWSRVGPWVKQAKKHPCVRGCRSAHHQNNLLFLYYCCYFGVAVK